LGVISRSPTELEPVLATIVETAARLCGADKAIIRRRQGDSFAVVAAHGGTAEQRQYLAQHPVAAGSRSVVGRVALTRRTVHIPDIRAEPGFTQFDLAQAAGFASLLAVPLFRKANSLVCSSSPTTKPIPSPTSRSNAPKPLPTRR